MRLAIAMICLIQMVAAAPALAQELDLSHGGPIDITAQDGIEWRQNEQQVIARGDARATRGSVTVVGDRLTAWYRKKGVPATAAGTQQPTRTSTLTGDPSAEGSEIYRLQADGHVRIFTATDQAQGDKAIYDLDQSVMVMTGKNLKLTTPDNTITARDDLEYWPRKHMAVARGDAVVVTKDAKRVAADTLVAYTSANPATGNPATGNPATGNPATGNPVRGHAAPGHAASAQTSRPARSPDDPLTSSGKLERVEAFRHVSVRTPTDTVTGDRGVYVLDSGMARLGGNVRITRGQNQLNGAEADVNMKTGIATLTAQRSGRVSGLVVPNDDSSKSLGAGPAGTTPAGSGPAGSSPAGSGQAGSGQAGAAGGAKNAPLGSQP